MVRFVTDTCKVPYLGELPCYGKYGFFDEDERAYCVGWTGDKCSVEVSLESPTVYSWKHIDGRQAIENN